MFSFFQTTSHILAPQRVSPISNYWLSVHVTALTFLSLDLRSYIVGEARRAEDRHLCPFLPCCTEPSLFCYRLHICPVALPKFICWNNLQCDGTWRWGLCLWLGHAGGVFMKGIASLIKEAPEKSPPLSTMWEYSEKQLSMNQEMGSSHT